MPLSSPSTVFVDPVPALNALRGIYQTWLLVASTHHLDVFGQFQDGPRTLESLRERLGLGERPAMVLFPALCAMGLLRRDAGSGRFELTEVGKAATNAAGPNLLGYLEFSADDPGVIEMAERLRHDGPRVKSDAGTAYVKEGDGPSPMDDPATARMLTLRLAGRARILAPLTARVLPRATTKSLHLVDVAAGSGYYAYEWLLANPAGTATVFDRPAVLRVAAECLEAFCREKGAAADGLAARVTFQPGDMLVDPIPAADVLLSFSLLHDWPAPTCALLARRFAEALNPGGEIWIHDEFLDDSLDGPLHAALYSAQLFWVTEGRIYSRGEHAEWLQAAGLVPSATREATALNYSLISARKS
jgi:hypothetical protein